MKERNRKPIKVGTILCLMRLSIDKTIKHRVSCGELGNVTLNYRYAVF